MIEMGINVSSISVSMSVSMPASMPVSVMIASEDWMNGGE